MGEGEALVNIYFRLFHPTKALYWLSAVNLQNLVSIYAHFMLPPKDWTSQKPSFPVSLLAASCDYYIVLLCHNV
jgi:hypothetical protein